MSENDIEVYEEQRQLVLARFKTLNQDSKLILFGDEEVTVKDLIKHIEEGDDFGKKVVHVQIKMLRVMAGGGA